MREPHLFNAKKKKTKQERCAFSAQNHVMQSERSSFNLINELFSSSNLGLDKKDYKIWNPLLLSVLQAYNPWTPRNAIKSTCHLSDVQVLCTGQSESIVSLLEVSSCQKEICFT